MTSPDPLPISTRPAAAWRTRHDDRPGPVGRLHASCNNACFTSLCRLHLSWLAGTVATPRKAHHVTRSQSILPSRSVRSLQVWYSRANRDAPFPVPAKERRRVRALVWWEWSWCTPCTGRLAWARGRKESECRRPDSSVVRP